MTALLACRTASAAATQDLAGRLAALVRGGDLLLLVGDLGAGKTAFTQGFARGLGVLEPVTSPTFTLARAYDGRLVLNHLDVYRLDHLSETADLGLGELLDSDGVTVIEWGDRVLAALPLDYLEVRLELGDDDEERWVTLRPVGPGWSARWEQVRGAVEAWAC
jgi:tRNA threonylcarbamoyladenosine biosynthesis protein TsaE